MVLWILILKIVRFVKKNILIIFLLKFKINKILQITMQFNNITKVINIINKNYSKNDIFFNNF